MPIAQCLFHCKWKRTTFCLRHQRKVKGRGARSICYQFKKAESKLGKFLAAASFRHTTRVSALPVHCSGDTSRFQPSHAGRESKVLSAKKVMRKCWSKNSFKKVQWRHQSIPTQSCRAAENPNTYIASIPKDIPPWMDGCGGSWQAKLLPVLHLASYCNSCFVAFECCHLQWAVIYAQACLWT